MVASSTPRSEPSIQCQSKARAWVLCVSFAETSLVWQTPNPSAVYSRVQDEPFCYKGVEALVSGLQLSTSGWRLLPNASCTDDSSIIDNKLKSMSALCLVSVVTQVHTGGSAVRRTTDVSCTTSKHDPESDTWTPMFRHQRQFIFICVAGSKIGEIRCTVMSCSVGSVLVACTCRQATQFRSDRSTRISTFSVSLDVVQQVD